MSDQQSTEAAGVPRRAFLRYAAGGAAAVALGTAGGILVPNLRKRGLLSADGVFDAASIAFADSIYTEVFPTSPLILSPFSEELAIPKALRPVPESVYSTWAKPPSPDNQNSLTGNNAQRHQIWPTVKPLVYKIDLLVRSHSFTRSKVLPIDKDGRPAVSFDASGKKYAAGVQRTLPASTIYGFNGTFPGPMINAEYGRPVLVRFENHLDENPLKLDRQDFGAPDWSFLTHLHNGHTAPESDGNPHYSMNYGPKSHGYLPKMWVDNLYLNWPAGGQECEKQSFFWFHDHRMDHTGSNVYKGMVGLFPIYDRTNSLDMGNERTGLRLPGRRTNNGDGSFDVAYDIPLALFDCRLDDGVTTHQDMHDGAGEFPLARNPRKHPEWWGKTFFKHFPNHGFVGDIFTVNGQAYPTLHVKRRKYRLRFLDASVARIYELAMMSSTNGPKSAASLGYGGDELQGQYRLPDGEQCMKFCEIASDGGLLPYPVTTDSFELWPAKRREVVIDFSRYMDDTPTSDGDEIYLTNIMKMTDGRMWDTSSRTSLDPDYKVPLLKFVIDGAAMPQDDSLMPAPDRMMREMPPLPANWKSMMDERLIFEVQRGSAGGEIEWLINGEAFDPSVVTNSLKNPAGKTPLAKQKVGSYALWEVRNGGGGWVHPFHFHMEEHRVVMRDGQDVGTGSYSHPDNNCREDVVALDPSESVIIYRGFRDFVGPYVAHCHNLAHEDHAMMFGWEITP